MNILHILRDGSDDDARVIIDEQGKSHEIEVIDLSLGDISYDVLVDKIERCDKVISW